MGLFNSSKTPKQKAEVKLRQQQNDFEENAPAPAFMKAREAYYDAVGRVAVDRARLFILAALFGTLALVEGLVILQLVPLKTTEPFVIAYDKSSGMVGRAAAEITPARVYNPERPVIERELFSFVERLYAINADYPKIVKDGHVAAYAYTRGRASDEFRAFIGTEQPYERQAKIKGLTRMVEKKTMSFKEDGKLVLLRFRAIERSDEASNPATKDLVITIQFTREQPIDPAELEVNPLGIYIKHFEIVEDR